MMRRERSRLALIAAAAALAGCTGAVEGQRPGNEPGPAGGSGGRPPGQMSTPPGTNPIPGTPGAPPTTPGAAAEKPGRTPLRRLTRIQYNNTVRDLLGVSGDSAAAFAGDEDAGGFKSNLISPVSEPQVEQYHRAAEDLATKAVAGGLARLSPCTPPPDRGGHLRRSVREGVRQAGVPPAADPGGGGALQGGVRPPGGPTRTSPAASRW